MTFSPPVGAGAAAMTALRGGVPRQSGGSSPTARPGGARQRRRTSAAVPFLPLRTCGIDGSYSWRPRLYHACAISLLYRESMESQPLWPLFFFFLTGCIFLSPVIQLEDNPNRMLCQPLPRSRQNLSQCKRIRSGLTLPAGRIALGDQVLPGTGIVLTVVLLDALHTGAGR